MCTQLTQNGKIIVPGSKAQIKTKKGVSFEAMWGTTNHTPHGDLYMHHARLESVVRIWRLKGFKVGTLVAEAFVEEKFNFKFKAPRMLGIVYKGREFLVVTEPAQGQVKRVHHRQPCFQNIHQLLRA